MASETFLPTKYPFTHPLFSNDYLLKHGNFFTKPILHQDGYPLYPVMGESPGYRIYPDLKSENSDMPLNFVIKQEKPPTPSPSPTDVEAKDEQLLNGNSKNGTWISGKQKLSWDNSTVASYNPDTKMFRCVVCNAVGFLSRIAEHYLGTHTSAKVFQCLHCPYSSTWSRCVRMHMAKHHGVPNAPPSLWKGQPLLEEIFQLLTNLKTTVDSQGRERLDPEMSDKKFVCPKCPYTTDRRDLFLRHENIHKEDKPYHCYICFKLFNRADHVKKHFLRIHRGHPYDISLVRRRPPRVQSSVNGNSNSNHSNGLSSFSVDKLIASSNEAKSDNEVIDLSNHDASGGDTANSKQLKTFQCPYCSWEGVDSWCLRRHMNVHLKSFECPVCEFKAGKAERLFTHVYRAHRKLVCTKCKFITDLAHDFEIHIKECCLEIIVGNAFDKTSEDSLNESDDGSLEIKINNLSEVPSSLPTVLPDPLKMCDRPASLDLKGSVSLMPLHNSISYCYQGTQRFSAEAVNGLNGFHDEVTVNVNQDIKQSLLGNNTSCKAEVKPELASPVQSSSDSGVADVISDNNDHDYACWHCGCEFADQTSLLTHTDLYHREDLWKGKNSGQSPTKKTKKFSCAICNFNSDRQRTIIEHMRFHTGEVLACRAGPPCAFSTVSDSTLEKHVEKEHNDGVRRCPHCAYYAMTKVAFIRHYRKCHHSKSCLRCRGIKRSYDKPDECFSSFLRSGVDAQRFEVVRPYLHHNPYSRKSNAITPYSHCNAAMMKVAVAIPESSLQTAVDDAIIPPFSSVNVREHKPRKQSTPRKLLSLEPAVSSRDSSVCDIGRKNKAKKKTKTLAGERKRKLLKKLPNVKKCRLGHVEPFSFNSNVSYVRHFHWFHVSKKCVCYKCGTKFKHLYQVLIHKRRHHVQS